LVGSFNTRSFWSSGAANTSSGYVGAGIVGIMVVGNSVTASQDQRFINAVPDTVTNQLTGNTKFYVYKRPGLETHTTPQAGSPGTAVHIWIGQGSGNKVISAFGATNSTLYDGIASLGSTTGQVFDITETLIGTTPNLVFATNAGRGYFYPESGALTEITDVDYPYNVAGQTPTGTFVHLNGFSFILTEEGRIYNSDLNSISSWSATGYIATNLYPDRGIGLARFKNMIVAFGQESAELFRLTGGDTGSPLQAVQEGSIHIGAAQYTAITSMEDQVAWVASSATGSTSVYLMKTPGVAERISTDEIDFQLNARGSSDLFVTNTKLFGKTFVFVTFGGTTYVYSIEDNIWHQWSSANAILWHQWAANTATSAVLYSVSRNSASGKVYKFNPVSPVYSDDGTDFEMRIQTSKVDMDSNKRKFLHKLSVIGDEAGSSTNLSVTWSDDDYNTFSTARTIDLATSHQHLPVGGSFRRRAFKLSNTSSVPLRLEALELDYTEGIH
jgi:Phage stabilisation protein